VAPAVQGSAQSGRRSPVTLSSLAEKKASGTPIVMVTAYDYPSAQAIEQTDVDLVLAGDTAAEMTLGYSGTVGVSLEEMVSITAAVRRGLRTPLLVGDLPFGTYEASDTQAVVTAQRLVKEGGADVVKLERGGSSTSRVRAIVEAGIPVMGHLGLTPQSETSLGGRRAQGTSAERALQLLRDAHALQHAGCFAIVFEAVPAAIAELITAQLEIPTIGIGAGSGTDGQVLVWHDLLGLYDWRPRFARAFADLRPQIISALARYGEDVRARSFPAEEHTYRIDERELDLFKAAIRAAPNNEVE
jgi:3-methyl-2-oxobutanoate hydroxymethyltransferase